MTAPVSDTIVINVTRDTAAVTRASHGTPLYLSYTAAWAERVRTYSSLADVLVDFVAGSPEALVATAVFSQKYKPTSFKIGRGALKPTLVYTMSLATPAIGTPYVVTVKGQGVTTTTITINPLADVVVTSVTNVTDLFNKVAHGMATGDGPYRLTNAGGGLPAGSAVDTDYWIIASSADTFKIATSKANALAGTAVDITTDGTGTHTVQRDANDVMVAQLVDRLNTVVGNNYLAAQVAGAGDTDTLTVTADAAGLWFAIDVVDPALVTASLTHVDPGVATDLAAVLSADADWYALLTGFNSNALVVAAAAWIEANKRQYFVDVANTVSATGLLAGAGQDIGDNLRTLSYERSPCFFGRASEFLAAGVAGRYLPTTPGEATVKFKRIVGCTPSNLTSTHRVNLRAKKMNWLERSAGLNQIFDGTVPSGEYIDVIRDLDYVVDDMQVRIMTSFVNAEKVGFDDPGIAVIEADVRAALLNAVELRIFKRDPRPTVEVPLAANVSASDKAARNLTGVKWGASLVGAIHKVNPINGVVSL